MAFKTDRRLIKPDIFFVIACTLMQFSLVLLNQENVLRTSNGFLFITFLPGYSLLAAFYRPYRKNLSSIEHIVLSIPLSIALNALLGTGFSNLSWGNTAHQSVIWMSIVILGFSIIGLIQKDEDVEKNHPPGKSIFIFSAILLFITGWQLISIQYASPEVSLSLLDANAGVTDYPRRIAVNQSIDVNVEVINTGYTNQQFLLKSPMEEIIRLNLKPQEKWVHVFKLAPTSAGKQIVQWNLYLPGDNTHPYRSIHLWIDVQ